MQNQFDLSRAVVTKLAPFYRVKGYVRREQLFNRLQHALLHKLTIISAAAGYGKTSLLSDFYNDLQKKGVKVAWLTLDEEDQTPSQFLFYILAAFDKANIKYPDISPLVDNSVQNVPLRSISASFFKVIDELDEPVALILDDYHRAASDELNRLFEWLVRFSPRQLHIVIASRENPDFMREDLRAQSELLEFITTDLAFTTDDVRQVFDVMGVPPVDAGEISRLTDRTEGWPLAVELALKWSLGSREKTREVSEFSGRTFDLARYLSEQILSGLPPDFQSFLLDISILPRVNGDLANAVTKHQDSWTRLEKLEQQNVFLLPMDSDSTWFRFHPLVAEFLKDRLARNAMPEYIEKLHQQAAHWFGNHDYLGEALIHAAAARDDVYRVNLLEQAGGWRLIMDGRLPLIRSYLPETQSPLLDNRPRLQLACVFLKIKSGLIDEAKEYFISLKEVFNNPDTPRIVCLEAQMMGDMISEYEDRPVRQVDIRNSEDLISELPGNDSRLLALANESLATRYYFHGYLDQSLAAIQQANRHYQQDGSLYGQVFTLFHEGLVKLEQGKLNEAENLLAKLVEPVDVNFGPESDLAANLAAFRAQIMYEKNEIESADTLLSWALPHMESSDGWYEVYSSGYLTAAWCAFSLRGPEAATEVLDRARSTARRRHLDRLVLVADLCEIELCVVQDELAKAQEIAASIQLYDKIGQLSHESLFSRQVDCRIGIAAARLDTALGRPLNYLPALEKMALSNGLNRQLMEIRIILALQHFSACQYDRAAEYIDKALSLAVFEGNYRAFLQEGEKASDLMNYITGPESPLTANRFRGRFLKEIENAIHQKKQHLAKKAAENTLSKKELETLKIVDMGLTNKEIALKLDISPSTVKYRLKALYIKLQVSSRKEAVKRAHDEGWFDQQAGL